MPDVICFKYRVTIILDKFHLPINTECLKRFKASYFVSNPKINIIKPILLSTRRVFKNYFKSFDKLKHK